VVLLLRHLNVDVGIVVRGLSVCKDGIVIVIVFDGVELVPWIARKDRMEGCIC